MLKKLIKRAVMMLYVIMVALSVFRVSAGFGEDSGDEWLREYSGIRVPQTRVRPRVRQSVFRVSAGSGEDSGDEWLREYSGARMPQTRVHRRFLQYSSPSTGRLSGPDLLSILPTQEGYRHTDPDFDSDAYERMVEEAVPREILDACPMLYRMSSDESSTETESATDEESEGRSAMDESSSETESATDEEFEGGSAMDESSSETERDIAEEREDLSESDTSSHESVDLGRVEEFITSENRSAALSKIDELSLKDLVSDGGASLLRSALITDQDDIAKKLIEKGVPLLYEQTGVNRLGQEEKTYLNLLSVAFKKEKADVVKAMLDQVDEVISYIFADTSNTAYSKSEVLDSLKQYELVNKFLDEDTFVRGPWGTKYEEGLYPETHLIWKLLAGGDQQDDGVPLVYASSGHQADVVSRLLTLMYDIADGFNANWHGDKRKFEVSEPPEWVEFAVNRPNNEGNNALIAAVKNQDLKIISSLLDCKANPDISPRRGGQRLKTPLKVAKELAESSGSEELQAIQKLLELYKDKRDHEAMLSEGSGLYVSPESRQAASQGITKAEEEIKELKEKYNLPHSACEQMDESEDDEDSSGYESEDDEDSSGSESEDEDDDEGSGGFGIDEFEPSAKRRRVEE